MNIQRGDIVFLINSKSKLSNIIARVMQSKWSHSAIVADVSENDIYLHETSDTQTKVGLMSYYLKNPDIKMQIIRVSGVSVNEAAKYHNKMYGYVRFLGAGIRRLFMRLGWKKAPMFWSIGGPLCMTLPHSALKAVHVNMPEVNSMDTEELYQWCLKNGAVVFSIG